MTHKAPPFDPELARALAARRLVPTRDLAALVRARVPTTEAAVEALLAPFDIVREDRRIPGADGDVLVSVFRRRTHVPGGPGLLFAHSGGMVVGDRFQGIGCVLEWVQAFDAVAISVEYRLAPEHPYPAAVNDCFAALHWAAEQAPALGFDRGQLVIVGISAGGGLAAATALMARDQGGPALAGQILICPMIDDRSQTVSSQQIQGIGVWDRATNQVGWRALLGELAGGEQVPVYAAPARATDLAGLPPAYIDSGSVEVFRDEAVAYASGIWAAGGSAELHVWSGGFHAFELIAPDAAASVASRSARTNFLKRLLSTSEKRGAATSTEGRDG